MTGLKDSKTLLKAVKGLPDDMDGERPGDEYTSSPNAPPSSVSKNRPLKIDGKTRVSMLMLPKTPESQVSIRNEIVISSQIKPITGNGKSSSSSHIRKSLRTIEIARKKGFNRNRLKGR
ncbi:hypothetical protein L2E82_51155 [Cichorium intybus]|nr:hypothetical protein L2E82_51155 [Cichorium intybus]